MIEGKILGIGNPLLDILADVDQSFLDKYEVKMNNAILCEDKHKPMYKELVELGDVKYIAGGATQNSIRVAQWMLKKPNQTAYIGCIGKDKFGEQLKESAIGDGVSVHYLEDESVPTGTCATLILNKERSLVANLSAANEYKKEHFDSQNIQDVLRNSGIVYSAGFFLTVSPSTALAAGQHCAENNKFFCMNLSAPFICQFFSDQLLQSIPYVDIMFGNESEAQAFGEKQGLSDTSVRNVALEISKMEKVNKSRSRLVVITQGSEPTVVVRDGEVTEYPVPKLAPEDIIDVNGAGDSFVAGFLSALKMGKDIKTSVEAGHYCASVILGASGCAMNKEASFKL